MAVFILVRAITCATISVGLVLFLLPAWLLSGTGIERPASIGAIQVAGTALALAGGVLALWCVLAFAVIGKGTPAPFDPPRLLVVRRPYAAVRNPMYIGAGLVLLGASLFFLSFALEGFLAAFWLAAHLFVVAYGRAGAAANLRRRLRGVLPPGAPLVAAPRRSPVNPPRARDAA